MVVTSEIVSVGGPSESDDGGFGAVLCAVEKKDTVVEDDGGRIVEVCRLPVVGRVGAEDGIVRVLGEV